MPNRMSSSDIPKKKRNRRSIACELCRSKKVRCEYGDGTQCARCLSLNVACSGRRGLHDMEGAETLGLVKGLEQKLHQMESVLVRMSLKQDDTTILVSSPSISSADGLDWHDGEVHDEIKKVSTFLEGFPPGQSSDVVLLREALDIRKSTTQGMKARPSVVFDHAWGPIAFQELDSERAPKQLSFPEPDLLRDLVDLYFEHSNNYFWLLHRPSFERSISEGLHLEDRPFGEVVLLVAALGSQRSNDPRVLLDDNRGSWISSGWKWFSQVQVLPKSFFRPPSLYELQKICLACCFCSCGNWDLTWSLSGIGLRLAQGMGLHYMKKRGQTRTIEAELWKRAFWTLLCIDRLSCLLYGRPCFTHEEQFDIELPDIADEEYWDHPNPKKAFKQPDRKQSKQVFFITMIQLTEILAFTLRTIYATGKFKAFLAKSNPRWREEVLRKVDSALNHWHDSIPDYLRWPVYPTGSIFYYQASGLYMAYHWAQIHAHWQFIPSLIGQSSLSLSSLVVCANSARAGCHMFETFMNSAAHILQGFHAPHALSCGMILLLYIWEAKKFGLGVDPVKELKNIRHCLNYVKLLKSRFAMEIEWSGIELLERLVIQEELSNLGAVDYSSPTTDPLPSSPSLAPNSNSASPAQLSNDFDDMFRAFMNDGLIGGSLGFDGIDVMDGFDSEDSLYSSVLNTFSAAVPLHTSPIPETSF